MLDIICAKLFDFLVVTWRAKESVEQTLCKISSTPVSLQMSMTPCHLELTVSIKISNPGQIECLISISVDMHTHTRKLINLFRLCDGATNAVYCCEPLYV